jgi:hypothetical protein
MNIDAHEILGADTHPKDALHVAEVATEYCCMHTSQWAKRDLQKLELSLSYIRDVMKAAREVC